MVEIRVMDDASELEPFLEAIDQSEKQCAPHISIVYLVDTGSKSDPTLLQLRLDALKRLFESEEVTKVIHDCRMDCDALHHLFDIHLENVHDSSCYQYVISGASNVSLNDTLRLYGIEVNDVRDKSVYKGNPAFWATRPLTSKMTSWASGDVDKLLALASKQVARLEARGESSVERAKKASKAATTLAAHMKLARKLYCKGNIGRFIGKGGCNLHSLENRTGTLVYKFSSSTGPTEWMVFYPSEQALQSVKRAMGY
eukprot:Nitzschia sp. Nitz4//scaffold108_size72880//26120//26963//NITZ4_005812-RA/size72880-processed-gene-0.50-mRNA-1//-1//CDS//3329532660//8547//frame0